MLIRPVVAGMITNGSRAVLSANSFFFPICSVKIRNRSTSASVVFDCGPGFDSR